MRKRIISILVLTLSLSFLGCGKGSVTSSEPVNNAPSTVNLVFPTQNLLCIDNSITFDWSDATDSNKDAVSYTIIIAKKRDLTNIVQEKKVNSSQIKITLDKGIPYYWNVTSIDSKGKEGTPSPVYAFYTKGDGVINSAPFTAKLVSPLNNSTNSQGTVSLKWIGADANTTNTLTYELFFGENSDPSIIENSLSTETHNVNVTSGKTYYWKVNTIDNSGAKSIGQIWKFTVD